RQWYCYCYASHSLRPAGTENVFTLDLPLVVGSSQDAEASRQTAIPKFAQYLHTKHDWNFTSPTPDSRGPWCDTAGDGNMMERRSDEQWKRLKERGERVALDYDFRFVPPHP
ncbi:MAG TPA: hypothetical protein VH054_05535, partial [Polyangiaceae bacterium]|nr:hypothetical protein [Polyangiaceae bacterium]